MNNMFNIENKTVLVTDVDRPLGLALANLLKETGACIYGVGRSQNAPAEFKGEYIARYQLVRGKNTLLSVAYGGNRTAVLIEGLIYRCGIRARLDLKKHRYGKKDKGSNKGWNIRKEDGGYCRQKQEDQRQNIGEKLLQGKKNAFFRALLTVEKFQPVLFRGLGGKTPVKVGKSELLQLIQVYFK